MESLYYFLIATNMLLLSWLMLFLSSGSVYNTIKIFDTEEQESKQHTVNTTLSLFFFFMMSVYKHLLSSNFGHQPHDIENICMSNVMALFYDPFQAKKFKTQKIISQPTDEETTVETSVFFAHQKVPRAHSRSQITRRTPCDTKAYIWFHSDVAFLWWRW